MAVVTLTGHLGSMGHVGQLVATTLGYDLVDRELVIEASKALGWTEEQVAAFDERTDGLGGRLTRLLRGFVERAGQTDLTVMASGGMESVLSRTYADTGAPEMRPDDERYVETLKATMLVLADAGDIVIVGRGGQALLSDRADALHVRVVCDVDARMRRIAEREGESEEDARKRVEHSDGQREAWHHKYFDVDYRSPYLYHLVVNTGLLSDEDASALIVHAVRMQTTASA